MAMLTLLGRQIWRDNAGEQPVDTTPGLMARCMVSAAQREDNFAGMRDKKPSDGGFFYHQQPVKRRVA